MKKINSKIENGFTFIEIVVSISILLFIILGVGQVFPFGAMILSSSEKQTIASYVAQAKIEEQISLGYDDIPIGNIEAKHRLASSSDSYLYNFQRKTDVFYLNKTMTSTSTDPVDDIGIKIISTKVYFFDGISENENKYKISFISTER